MTKCGSTTIQSFLRSREDDLREMGVAYIQPHVEAGHPELLVQIIDAIDGLDGGIEHVVASHENLLEARREDVLAFMDALDEREIATEVVVVVRRLSDWMISKERQRYRSLKGADVIEPPHVDQWLNNWLGRDMAPRLARRARVINLNGDRGLLPTFASAMGLPKVNKWSIEAKQVVNQAPGDREFALFLLLGTAVQLAIESVDDPSTVLNERHTKRVRKFIRVLLSSGDHHRNPKVIELDADLRDDLLGFMMNEIEYDLRFLAGDDSSDARAIAGVMKEARSVPASDEAGKAIQSEWVARFTDSVNAQIPPVAEGLREWCASQKMRGVAEIMLDQPDMAALPA